MAHGVFLLAQSGLLSLEHLGLAWSGGLAELGSFEDCIFGHDAASPMTIGLTISGAKLWPHGRRKRDLLDAEFHVAYEIRAKDDPGGYVSSIRITDPTSEQSVVIKRRRGRHLSFQVQAGSDSFVWKPSDADYGYSRLALTLGSVLRKAARKQGSKTRNKSALKRLETFVMSMYIAAISQGLQRVSSARFGPRRLYERGTLLDPEVRGDATSPLLASITPEMVDDVHVHPRKFRFRHRELDKRKIQRQLLELNIATDLSVREISAYHRAIFLRDSETGIAGNLIDYGYGVSQVLPVLWGLGSIGPGPLVLEQPEVHLHPSAQGHVGEYIVAASQTRQILVETHSEHIINRARLAVARGNLDAADVMILYVDRDKDGSRAVPIPLDSNGDFLAKWPNGFFEERFEDTMQLARLRK